jgi:signal transduction histidine kinase
MSAAPRADEAWSLFDFSPLFSGGLERFLEGTLETCGRWFSASGGSVFLKGEDGAYRVRARSGHQVRIPDDAEVRAGEGLAGAVIQEGAARIVQGSLAGSDVATSMILPLTWGSQGVIGVMNLSRQEGERRFDAVDLEAARAMAGQMAAAVANALLLHELEQAREQLQAVLAAAPALILLIEPDGILRPLAGQRASDPAPIHHAQNLAPSLAGLTEAEVHILRDPDQNRAWLARAQPLPKGGSVLSIQEVTEHQKALEERARIRRLAEIGQMTASIAHEIRNPLTGIRSAAQLMAECPELSPELCGIVRDEADRLEGLCSEFLDYSRPLSLNWEHADMAEIGRQAEAMLSSEASQKGVSLAFNLDSGPPTILCDRARIHQSLLNLVRNAIQASSPGQTVEIAADSGGITVQDSGTGMTEDQMDRLFSPFFTTKPDGTGLGLSTVRRIVEAHGWQIEAQSRPGEGARFRISWGGDA